MLTNRLGLPQAIVDAVKNDPYTKGESDISVTQLIQPPYQRKLRLETEVVEDVLDRIWSLVGQVGHGIVERAYPEAYEDEGILWIKIKDYFTKLGIWGEVAEVLERKGYTMPQALSAYETHRKHGVVAEKRLFTKSRGWTVSGQFDVIDNGHLQDYKFTSVWSVLGDTKGEWVNQLNLLRLLAIREGIQVKRLGILAILRDWSKAKSKQADYPKHQIVPIEIPMWSVAQAEAYLDERVAAHQEANPPPCTDDERWKREDVFAVMRSGRKSAIKLHDTRTAAASQAFELGTGYSVEHRPGSFFRCQEYCNVAHNCPQMKTEVGF